jgi:D-alanine transaminase
MTERIWFNGRVMPIDEAHVSVEDRGFQFADGVYEVIRLYGGKPFALDEHLARLERSAAGIQLQWKLDRAALADEIIRFIKDAGEAMIYLQATRGVAPRNHLFPSLVGLPETQPTLLFYVRPLPVLPAVEAAPGVKLLALPDERWQRCWIKSIALLPNVLAKSAAVATGAEEAVFVDGEFVTECSASNLFGVIGGRVVTHPVGKKVLQGVTRDVLLKLAANLGVAVEERSWTQAEAVAADELFITSTTREISWVSHWNGKPVRPGRAGPITQRLHRALKDFITSELFAAATGHALPRSEPAVTVAP